jgi:hypothetical protein
LIPLPFDDVTMCPHPRPIVIRHLLSSDIFCHPTSTVIGHLLSPDAGGTQTAVVIQEPPSRVKPPDAGLSLIAADFSGVLSGASKRFGDHCRKIGCFPVSYVYNV